jgi:hypothetical protein
MTLTMYSHLAPSNTLASVVPEMVGDCLLAGQLQPAEWSWKVLESAWAEAEGLVRFLVLQTTVGLVATTASCVNRVVGWLLRRHDKCSFTASRPADAMVPGSVPGALLGGDDSTTIANRIGC